MFGFRWLLLWLNNGMKTVVLEQVALPIHYNNRFNWIINNKLAIWNTLQRNHPKWTILFRYRCKLIDCMWYTNRHVQGWSHRLLQIVCHQKKTKENGRLSKEKGIDDTRRCARSTSALKLLRINSCWIQFYKNKHCIEKLPMVISIHHRWIAIIYFLFFTKKKKHAYSMTLEAALNAVHCMCIAIQFRI